MQWLNTSLKQPQVQTHIHRKGGYTVENDDKLFEFMTKMYGEMQRGFKEVNNRLGNVEDRLGNVEDRLVNVEDRLGNVEDRLGNVEDRLGNVEKSVIFIENDHGRKLDSLFDGYKLNYEKLAIIEEEVSKHDEVILHRVSEKL